MNNELNQIFKIKAQLQSTLSSHDMVFYLTLPHELQISCKWKYFDNLTSYSFYANLKRVINRDLI